MFGLFKVQLPASIQSKLANHRPSLKYGRSVYAYALGLISALIVGACVSPILISALSVALKTGDPLLGALMMFSMAMGMGVCLILFSLGANVLLPKAGAWMTQINHLFGFMLLGVAIYLLGVLPQVPVLLLWSIWLITLSAYIGAFLKADNTNILTVLRKGLGLFLLFWGVLAILGGFSGQRDLFQPINFSGFISTGEHSTQASSHFTRVTSIQTLERLINEARQQNKPVLIDYYADWCTDCVRMEQTTFKDAQVATIINQQFVAIQIDVTDSKATDTSALKKRFGVYGPPATLFINHKGEVLTQYSFYGYRNAQDFLNTINNVLK